MGFNSDFKSTNDSFIFSFTNRTNFQSGKVSYSRDGKNSLGCDPTLGPDFNYDLYCGVHAWYSYPNFYPKIDITCGFSGSNKSALAKVIGFFTVCNKVLAPAG